MNTYFIGFVYELYGLLKEPHLIKNSNCKHKSECIPEKSKAGRGNGSFSSIYSSIQANAKFRAAREIACIGIFEWKSVGG